MPINCFAEILEAISEASIAYQVSDPSARKKSVDVSLIFFFVGKSFKYPLIDLSIYQVNDFHFSFVS